MSYAVDIAAATRASKPDAPPAARDYIEWGAGPRASQYLVLGAKALALLDGRTTPETADVRARRGRGAAASHRHELPRDRRGAESARRAHDS